MNGLDLPLRYLLSFGIPFAGTLLATPVLGRLALRKGIVDRPSINKFHLQATPYLGGAALGGSFLLVAVAIAGASAKLLAVLVAALVVCVLGLVDDQRTVRPQTKLVVETGAAIVLWTVGLRAEIFGFYGLDLAVTVLWVVALTNAFNLLDNMDGLTAGVATISALTFFGIAASHGDFVVASFCLALAGASLGFLRHNFPPAKIFLGDAGALLVGFLIAALGLESQLVGHSGILWSLVPLMVVAVPLIDTTFVVISRIRAGRPIYLGGTDHTSHRLAGLGLTPSATASVIYAAQFTFSALALWLVIDGSLTPLIAAPFVLAAVAMGLRSLVIAPRLIARAGHNVIELDVIDLDVVELPGVATVAPVFSDGGRGS
jgi:UDP-GlcNAc:undecaprenyl-phosphate/decaprenyl-phosphate GlcNAc-1-phosphate transferase